MNPRRHKIDRFLRSGIALVLLLFCLAPVSIFAKAAPDSTEIDTTEALPDSITAAHAPAPVTGVVVADTDNDAGGSITVTWVGSADDREGGNVKFYRVLRADEIGGQPGKFVEVGDSPAGKDYYSYEDGKTTDDSLYFYKVVAANIVYNATGEGTEFSSESVPAGPITSSQQWFSSQRINTLKATMALCFFILFFIFQAQGSVIGRILWYVMFGFLGLQVIWNLYVAVQVGSLVAFVLTAAGGGLGVLVMMLLRKWAKDMYIRSIAGIEAIDEAVGRATEMGRKIFFIPGIGDMDNMQTIAGVTILGRVAELSAEYDTYLDVPVCRSMVMVTGREVLKEAYSKVGRPDSYSDDQVHYVTDDQFGYAAGVDGMFVREKPATVFFMGQFFAESLILAETGNSIGAIQIAGTAMPSQLPFFVASCDYTLIGEELFAASAYLSKEPKLLGSLKGQDMGKAVVLGAMVLGLLLEILGIWELSSLFSVSVID